MFLFPVKLGGNFSLSYIAVFFKYPKSKQLFAPVFFGIGMKTDLRRSSWICPLSQVWLQMLTVDALFVKSLYRLSFQLFGLLTPNSPFDSFRYVLFSNFWSIEILKFWHLSSCIVRQFISIFSPSLSNCRISSNFRRFSCFNSAFMFLNMSPPSFLMFFCFNLICSLQTTDIWSDLMTAPWYLLCSYVYNTCLGVAGIVCSQ